MKTTPTDASPVGDAVRRHDGLTTEPSKSTSPTQTTPQAPPDDAMTNHDRGLEKPENSAENIKLDVGTAPLGDAEANGDGSIRLYTVTLAEVRKRLSQAQLYRSERTLQRYCDKGILDCNKAPTAHGQEWLVTDRSIEKFINDTPIDVVAGPKTNASIKQPEATPSDAEILPLAETSQNQAEPSGGAKDPTGSDKEILLERMVDMQQSEISHLRTANIGLNERIHESNVIAQNLQSTILKLTGKEDPKQIHDYEEKSTPEDAQSVG